MGRQIPLELYQKIHQEMPIVCVDIVVRYNGKIIVIKRDQEPAKNQWWFPGGRLLRDESLIHAASRITQSETGLSLRHPVYLGQAETLFEEDPFGHGGGTHTINFIYSGSISELGMMAITLDQDHTAYSAFSPDEIYQSDIHSYVKRFVALSEGVST